MKYAIMGLLADGPLHGYDLKATYEADLVPTSRLNFGQVYSTLDRLSRDGWVENEHVVQAERPDKKVYQLTDRGREELRAWLAAPSKPDLELRNNTFVKIMVARRIRGGDALAVLAGERRACLAHLHEVTRARSAAESDGAALQTVLLLELAALRLEAFCRWLDTCEDALRKEADS